MKRILTIAVVMIAFTGCSKKSSGPTIATLTATTISGITRATATGGGNISSDGGATVTTRGLCWSTSSNPTVALTTKTTDGTGTGSYTSSITGLLPSTTYYVRSYATNSVGTAYTAELTFITLANTSLTIGMTFGGGIVAYILQPGDPGYDASVEHGLIAATSDQSSTMVWWNGTNVTTGDTGTAIGTGLANTNAIIAAQGSGTYAASICRSLTFGGNTDWYLPSKDELNKLCINQTAIGGFASAYYWSSSEYVAGFVWAKDFPNGGQAPFSTNYPGYVRAVRSF